MVYQAKKPCPLKQVEKGIEVELPEKLYDEIMYLVDKSPIEISGLGKCKFEDGVWKVLSIYLPTQVNTATSTDLDAESVGKIEFESIKEDGHLNFWWHSHVNMGAFWSGTDTDTIEEYGRNGFCLATVFNKRGETKTAYYQGSNGFLPSIFMNDMTLRITECEKAANPELDAMYEERCRRPKYVQTTMNNKKLGTNTTTALTSTGSVLDKYARATSDKGLVVRNVIYKYAQGTDGSWGCFTYAVFHDDTYLFIGKFFSKFYAKKGYQEWKTTRKTPLAVLSTPVTTVTGGLHGTMAARIDFEIHPTVHNLRWNKTLEAYFDYEKYTPDEKLFNHLDVLGIREEAIEGYYQVHPDMAHVTDTMVDYYWMRVNDYTAEEFYYGALDTAK